MIDLYPLKFAPILKEKLWGSNLLHEKYNKNAKKSEKIGESWEISSLQNNISKITNGYLSGNNLEDIIEVYMGDLVGDAVYEQFGKDFPLLVKLIDARQDISIQVHPNDELAQKQHKAFGKTEMWYILESEKEAKIYTGFKNDSDKEKIKHSIEANTLPTLLNFDKTQSGDVFFIPAGTIHSIGAGNILVEIQQSSDLTYRLYDWGRMGLDGLPRELHIDLALDAINYKPTKESIIRVEPLDNKSAKLIRCKYFTANIISFEKELEISYNEIDSFVIYVCTQGSFNIENIEEKIHINIGETILLPASLNSVKLTGKSASFLEVYIDN